MYKCLLCIALVSIALGCGGSKTEPEPIKVDRHFIEQPGAEKNGETGGDQPGKAKPRVLPPKQ